MFPIANAWCKIQFINWLSLVYQINKKNNQRFLMSDLITRIWTIIVLHFALANNHDRQHQLQGRGSFCKVISVLDWDIVESKLELPLRWNIHFRTNTPEKGINSSPSYGCISSIYSTTTSILQLYSNGCGHLWWCNGSQARLANLHEWVRVSLGTPFIRPCAASKQKAS